MFLIWFPNFKIIDMENKIVFTQQLFSKGKVACIKYGLQLLLAVIILSSSSTLFAQLPSGFVAKKLTLNNVRECVAMAHAPDGRIFLAERGGIVKLYQNGSLTTLHTVATTTDSEQGLLGIALHSNFATNGKCYLYYTNTSRTRHYLDVIVISPSNVVTSNNRLMEFDQIINGFHNGGAMVFKDNHLYICIGESNAQATAQQLDTYMGKVLRLQEDGQPAVGNPYYNSGVNRQQKSIWAIGMRNPWAMSMDPATKKLYSINVGGGWEEINDVTNPEASKNYNYGWGSDNRSGPDQPANTIVPVFAYQRSLPGWNAQTCAITSGTAFNPPSTNYPAQYRNKFYFSDWCTGWLRSFDMNNPAGGYQELFPTGFGRILGTSTGVDGNIYYSEYGGTGNLWRLEYTLTTAPVIANHPQSKSVIAGDPVTFSVSASGSNPLSYQWQKNGVNISGATSLTYTINATSTSDAGQYRAVVTNSFGTATSNAAALTVEAFNAAPVAKINSPVSTTKWSVGDVIAYSGTATDSEDGNLPASAYVWNVELFHKDCPTCEHSHPGPGAPDGVTSGTFLADNGGETSSNIWFRLYLKVTDSKGRIGRDSVDIHPNKVLITVQSSKPGLEVVIGSDAITPYTKSLVVNSAIILHAVTPQTIGDSIYTFSSWNHGGTSSQNISVPAVNTTYKVNYTATFDDKRNLALKKPAFASTILGGNVAINAVDGVANSRWESQFADPQWIYVDLGAIYSITRVKILWEAARARDYRIEISNDINNWGTPAKVVTGNTTNTNDWALAGTGRYVRVYGTARGTGYGYSIFELEVYGASAGGNIFPSANITSPANNSTFTAPASITINANATDSDGSISKVEFYNGVVKIGEDLSSPYTFNWTGVAAGTYNLTVKATDNLGASTTSSAIVVNVGTVSGTNLALNKPAFASTVLGGNVASRAVDGVANSRWESQFADPQWVYVDLGASYNVNRVKIVWEAARARDYRVEISNDINNWGTPVKVVTGNTTNTNDWTVTGTGRYVRVYGTARATGYGYSIFELEVYGTSTGTNTNTDVNLALSKATFASSLENGDMPASGAVDGNPTTRWSSLFADPQWIYVDLGASYSINRIKILWENAMASNYQIEVSNDINNWGTPVKVVTGNNTLENDWVVSATGRYVRVYGTTRASAFGYSIFELEVYGPSPARVGAVSTINETDAIHAFPNPISDELNVKATFEKSGFVNVLLVDVNGYVVLDQDFEILQNNFEQKISVSELPAGVYTLKLISGDEVFTEKVVKQ
jgi:glucose/arabinose dehydrogenase